eukprot:CAMPEP_0179251092 /NCGR_PEP_ID=MMETSP0797-20121207/21510_1 /TAXON_ID=47934 /ORGANISM="Dinophysis acuminata, Strain DAEP01" /LENGTH=31 /DNA_ID= /DNA_START= /DNA_END= /DNA_ORIENTATION=
MSKLMLVLPTMLLTTAGAMELTPENWDEETA